MAEVGIAYQSHTFSIYSPLAALVTCIAMKATMQLGLTVALLGVVGHCAICCCEPVKPPIRTWTSHMPLGVPLLARFHSMHVAPAWGPCVDTMKSLSSTVPAWPDVRPTCTTGCGLLMSLKKAPEDRMTG